MDDESRTGRVMEWETFLGVGWRQGLVAVVIGLLGYLGYAALRLRRIRRQSARGEIPSVALPAKAVIDAYAMIQEPLIKQEPEPLAPSGAAFPWNEPPEDLPARERIEILERDVEHCHRELRAIRAELAELRKQPAPSRVANDAAPFVAPAYQEAMSLAATGIDAVRLARECGISRAEAELVMALVKNRSDR